MLPIFYKVYNKLGYGFLEKVYENAMMEFGKEKLFKEWEAGKMTILRALTGSIENLPSLRLHILLTKEDDVIVARCLDFSVSSHGNSEAEALNSLSDSIKDYLGHAIEHGALDEIIDPDEDRFWEAFRKSELQVKAHGMKTTILPYALKGLIKKFELPSDIFDRK